MTEYKHLPLLLIFSIQSNLSAEAPSASANGVDGNGCAVAAAAAARCWGQTIWWSYI